MDKNLTKAQLLGQLKTAKIMVAITSISLVLTLLMMPLAFLEITWIPFVIFAFIYALVSFIATYMYTPLGGFFSYTYNSEAEGGAGCITVPLYLFVYPIVCFVSCFCFVGLIAALIKISKTSSELASLK